MLELRGRPGPVLALAVHAGHEVRPEVAALLAADGRDDLAARIRREWPGWTARIVPAAIAEVTGAEPAPSGAPAVRR